MLCKDTYYNLKKDYFDRVSQDYILNMIVSGRGLGKTYTIKEHFIDEFIDNGHRFAYVRRYKNECKESVQAFLSDMPLSRWHEQGFEVKIQNNKVLVNNEVAGYIYALSQALSLKGKAIKENDGLRIYNVCFDEFLLMKGQRYINGGDGYDEVPLLLELVSTLCRDSDFKLFMLANMADSLFSGYFRFFGLRPDIAMERGYEFCRSEINKNVNLQLVRSGKFEKEIVDSCFGKLVTATNSSYADYAIFNQSARDSDASKRLVCGKRPKNFNVPLYTLTLDGKDYGVWSCKGPDDVYIMDKKTHKSDTWKLVFSKDDMNIQVDTVRSIRGSFVWKQLLNWYNMGYLLFVDQECYYIFNKLCDLARMVR